MLASEMYARSQGDRLFAGKERCHWCGGACSRAHINDDEPHRPFIVNKNLARCPANPWTCIGCHLWRRPRMTINWMDTVTGKDRKGKEFTRHEQQDNQAPQRHSWFVTPEKALAVDSWRHRTLLYPLLLKPPPQFFLSFVERGYPLPNFLHCCAANDLPDVLVGSELSFTVNNVPFTWSPYELEQVLRSGKVPERTASGKQPGVAELIRLLGTVELEPLPVVEIKNEGKMGGHPGGALPTGKELKKSVGK